MTAIRPEELEEKPESLAFDDKDNSDSGKFKFMMNLLKKLIGVSDIINLRISLPSQVLDPIPNLEHFNWIDRPDVFASIDTSDDPVQRMLNVAKYCFSKDSYKSKHRVKKPYNSILGEYFLCSWDVNINEVSNKKTKVTMINEQTSHHPPVSAFWYECKETGVVARGCDHLSAKFTGTAIKIVPGQFGQGIYVKLTNRDEEYHITHCDAYISGWLTGSLFLCLAGRVIISCPKTKLRIIFEYKPERWIGKSKYAIEGTLFEYEPTFQNSKTHSDLPDEKFKLSNIPDNQIKGTLSGCWKEKIYYTSNEDKEKQLLIDISKLDALPKIVKPIEQMDELESRRVWNEVTKNILNKNYSLATKAKIEIEDKQRALAKERKDGIWKPKYFKLLDPDLAHCPQILSDVDIPY